MNLITKKVQVGDIKIKCAVTREMSDDLINLSESYYEYKFDNDLEKSIIEKYFKIYKVEDENICYFMDKRKARKIKLLVLEQCEFYEILKKIIKNSKFIQRGSGFDFIAELEKTLVDELSNAINKDILAKVMKLGNSNI